jgi:Domain of unknown function (DUF4936)
LRPKPVHLYIYYRIAAPCAADAQAAIEAIIDDLKRQFAVSGRLVRSQDDASLWMEIYEHVIEPMHFEAALNASLARTRFASWLSPGSGRRIERFVAFEERRGG